MTRDEMIATFAAYQTNYPNLVKSEVVGQTVEGRNLVLYKIGNPAGGPVMFSAGMHGFEKAAVEVLKLFVDWVLTSSDAEAVRIRQRNYVLVLPCLDLDGYPNASGMNKNSINLFRNFDFRYGQEGATHTKNPDWLIWTYYHGADGSPESEPEVQALLAAWTKFLPRHYIDMHVGSSDKKLWFTWLPDAETNETDAQNKQMMIDIGARYTKRSIAMGAPGQYPVEENTNSSGCPVSASYHRNDKKIFGWDNEIAPQNPTYSTIASIYWPAWKPVAIQLCEESAYIDANLHVEIGVIVPDPGDVHLARVHMGKTTEVNSFEMVLNNDGGKYSAGGSMPLALDAAVTVHLGRGSLSPLLFTGSLEKVKYDADPSMNLVSLAGRCTGAKWFRRLITKEYAGQKGEDVLIDLCTTIGLDHSREAVELIEDCDTTYTLLEYDYTSPFDILKYISESADLDDVIGFDARIAPDGKFEWFARGSKTSSVDVTEEANLGTYERSILPVRNKIWVFGNKLAQLKPTIKVVDGEQVLQCRCWPEDAAADLLTVDSLDNWTCELGSHSIDTTTKMVGADSYRVDSAVYSIIYQGARFKRSWPTTPLTTVGLDGFSSLNFWMKWSSSDFQNHKVQLLAPDESNYFYTDLTDVKNKAPLWLFMKLDIGPEYQYDADKNLAGKWIKVGNANWKNIQGIRFEIDGALNVNTVNLDGLHFGHARFRYMAEDTESPYELRESQETDDELYSNHECEMRAKALLEYLKSPVPDKITLKLPNLNYGMTPILAADKIHVHLPNEGVDTDYIVESAEYEAVGADNSLLVTLECGKGKKLMADYVYANLVMLKKLQKYKQTGAGSVG
jgi:hypothetical protein